MRNPLQRQFACFEDAIAYEIGDRHFCRRNQIKLALAFNREQICGELRQLPGAVENGR